VCVCVRERNAIANFILYHSRFHVVLPIYTGDKRGGSERGRSCSKPNEH